MNSPVPIVLSHKIAELKPNYFFCGGGEVDLKLKVDTKEFSSVFKPYIVDITMDD